jgi:hypothetical protein
MAQPTSPRGENLGICASAAAAILRPSFARVLRSLQQYSRGEIALLRGLCKKLS